MSVQRVVAAPALRISARSDASRKASRGLRRWIKIALSIGLPVLLAYVSTGTILWTWQDRLIFEPSRDMVVHAAQLSFLARDITIAVGGRPSGAQKLHAWWMPARNTDAKVFLYFHGKDGNVSTSVKETSHLRELGHSVLSVDYRGYGESDGSFPSEATMYEDAEATLAYVFERMHVAPRMVYVYGHSLGAAVAIDLAVKHPELGGLIVESGFTSIYEMSRLDGMYAIYPVKLLLNQRFDSLRKVSLLALPVLFIHGTVDDVVPFAMGKALFEHSTGHKRFLAVEGAKHENNSSVAPAALRAAISELVGANHRALTAGDRTI